jgi:putative hydrolase
MIDLHTHSIFSDGELIPSELARRAVFKGYRAIAITDHADHSNFDFIVPRIIDVCRRITAHGSIVALPGIEITHVHPDDIGELAKDVREMGAKIVVVHGETVVEPVISGTNRAALKAPIDILAHPGLITEDEVRLASDNSIYLEISTRKGHSLTNGHIAGLARKFNAKLVLNTDGHSPDDLVSIETARTIAAGAGLAGVEIDELFNNSKSLVEKVSQ